MRKSHQTCAGLLIPAVILAAVSSFNTPSAQAAAPRALVLAAPATPKTPRPPESSEKRALVIQAVEPEAVAGSAKKEVPWLGVATEECSEALAAQLGLRAGEGLVVSHVVPDSPAVKAGMEKNDVLTEFEGQVLVHPAQLRKLILMHKEGDRIKVTLFRGGKKDTVEVTLGKHKAADWSQGFRALEGQWTEFPMRENMREHMEQLRQSLKNAGVDKDAINFEVKRSVEEVRKSIQEALRQATNAARTFGPAAREFQELARRGVDVEKDATVVVKSKRNSVKSIVKTDDSGTYVIVASPKKQLTAHDKAGKLLFDGPIETEEDQDKVPREVWEKAKPMLEQLSDEKAEQESTEEDKDKS